VLSFESNTVVGVMVTSSHPGWSSVTGCSYRALQGVRGGGRTEMPTSLPTVLVTEGAPAADAEPTTDALCHLEICNSNFSRTADFVSLGDRALVEFVQLNAQHEPQLIWYRPVANAPNPWSLPAP